MPNYAFCLADKNESTQKLSEENNEELSSPEAWKSRYDNQKSDGLGGKHQNMILALRLEQRNDADLTKIV